MVYEGVNGKHKGTLFGGIKCCLLPRLPMRHALIDKIRACLPFPNTGLFANILWQDNGGEIVAAEQDADLVIADHARHHNPSGSVSWKYIDDCVDKGEPLNVQEYKIDRLARPTPLARAVGTKKIRNPFTDKDDKILIKWVLRAENAGKPISGNVIYRELAEQV
jgi:hypothetical protein